MADINEFKDFTSGLHTYGYLEKYLKVRISSKDLITTNRAHGNLSLNGKWNYSIDPTNWGLRAGWFNNKAPNKSIPYDYDYDTWNTIDIPSCWNTQDKAMFWYEGTVIFHYKFSYNKTMHELQFFKFEGVNYRSFIFINGKYLGYHDGGSTPFCVEATEFLEEENRLIVVVENTLKENRVPMENIDWFNYGGIFRDVLLLTLPKIFIKDFSLNLKPNTNYSKLVCRFTVSGKIEKQEAVLKINDKVWNLDVSDSYNEVEIDFKPKLWYVDSPYLYDISLEYLDDKVEDKIGFREIAIEGNGILLNGEKIFLKGTALHEDHIKYGRSLSDEAIRENYRLIKKLNGNFARLAHYPHSRRASEIADEMGVFLWEEIPVYWAIAFDNQETFEDAQNQLTELIMRDKNRASVLIWSIGNENPDTDSRLEFMSKLAIKTRELDNTRLVSAACIVDYVNIEISDRLIQHIDVVGINEYYGWYFPSTQELNKFFENITIKKPLVVSEFGAGALSGYHGDIEELFTEEKQEFVYQEQVKAFQKGSLAGVVAWILFDFRSSHRTNGFQQMFNRKGLVSEDKLKIKKAFYILQEYFGKK